MKKRNILALLLTLLMSMTFLPKGESQVVVALLFGDKLNSPNLKFGLDGGINFSSLTGNNQSLNAFISIPIGAGEKSKAKGAARKEKKQEKQQQKEGGNE